MSNIDEDDHVNLEDQKSAESPDNTKTMAEMIIQDSQQRQRAKVVRANKSVALTNNYKPNIKNKSFEDDDDSLPLATGSSSKSGRKNMASSVIPGTLISNTRM